MSRIGDFTLREQLADERHAQLWRAARADGSEVLLRRIEVRDAEHRAQLERWLGLELSHPRITAPHALITDEDGDDWLVQRWVAGEELSALLPPDSPLSLDDRLALVHGMLDGLAHAHGRGVVHGNLSPRTVIVRSDGAPTLVGFLVGDGAGVRGRRDAYASPEARARQPRTPASDVYAIAAVIEELLSDAAKQERSATATVVSALAPVLSAARHLDASERPADAERLTERIDEALVPLRGDRWWTTEDRPERSWSGLGRWSRVLALAVAAVLVVATGFGVVALTRATAPGAGPTVESSAPSVTAAPSASPSVSVTPSPTPTAPTSTAPPPQAGFRGTYRRTVTVTRVVNSDVKVGKRSSTTWRVTSRCSPGGLCSSVVRPAKGRRFTLGPDLTRISSESARCIDVTTGQPNGTDVELRTTEKLRIRSRSGDRVTSLVGTSTFAQQEACPQQTSPELTVVKRVTLRLVRS